MMPATATATAPPTEARLEAVRATCAEIARDCDAGYCDPHEVRPVLDRILAALDGQTGNPEPVRPEVDPNAVPLPLEGEWDGDQ